MDREKLVTDNLRIAHMMTRKYIRPKGYDYDDMYQEACIGLYIASETFDPSMGFKFSTIATKCIANRFYKIFRAESASKRQGNCVSIFTPTVKEDALELIDLIPDPLATDPEDRTIASETLNTLMEADGELVSLRLNGTSQAEIGQALGVSQPQIGRKLKKLKELVV